VRSIYGVWQFYNGEQGAAKIPVTMRIKRGRRDPAGRAALAAFCNALKTFQATGAHYKIATHRIPRERDASL
jgi:hypothetical protein